MLVEVKVKVVKSVRFLIDEEGPRAEAKKLGVDWDQMSEESQKEFLTCHPNFWDMIVSEVAKNEEVVDIEDVKFTK